MGRKVQKIHQKKDANEWVKSGPAAIRTQDLTVISRALHRAKLRAHRVQAWYIASRDTPNTHTGTLTFRFEVRVHYTVFWDRGLCQVSTDTFISNAVK